MKKRHQTRFILLGCWAWIMLNIPIVLIADTQKLIFGFPLFYSYLFLMFLVLIIGVSIALRKYVS